MSIVGVRMPCCSMVVFLLKLSIAPSPAFIIVSALAAAAFRLLDASGALMHTWV